jgi:hypothetical protein
MLQYAHNIGGGWFPTVDTWPVPGSLFHWGEGGSRKFAYKLMFKPFKNISMDCPTVFRIKEYFL